MVPRPSLLAIVRDFSTPNQSPEEIPVEYLVLHYTACNLKKTLDIFKDPGTGACAHLVVDSDGTVYELIPCLEQQARRGAHAGKSSWTGDDGQLIQGLNSCSLGIELVNLNGNVFPYTEAQYLALAQLLPLLAQRYPALNDPRRVLGHEHVAGFRGKVDPGKCFDWERVLRDAYPDSVALPQRSPCISEEVLKTVLLRVSTADATRKESQEFWTELSSECEKLSQGVVSEHKGN